LRGGKGPGDRGQELILNLQQSPGNLPFFSQLLNSYRRSMTEEGIEPWNAL